MSDGKLHLTITTPRALVFDRDVSYVQAEDPTGRFGLLPGHEPFLTTLEPAILVFRYDGGDGTEHEAFAATREGVLRVDGDEVRVAAREAVLAEKLEEVEQAVERLQQEGQGRQYRAARSLYQMQIAAWRRLMQYEDVDVRAG